MIPRPGSFQNSITCSIRARPHMIRTTPTRLLHSLPRRRRLSPTPRIASHGILVNIPNSSFSNLNFSSFIPLRLRDSHLPPAMEPAAGEDYVHVSDPDEAVPCFVDEGELNVEASPDHGLGDGTNPNSGLEQNSASDARKGLPEELAKGVLMLECESSVEGGVCDVYVVGTAHVSQESCREVKTIISYVKPQVVFLELCSSRVAILTPQNLQVPTISEMIDMRRKKKMNTFGILYSWFLAKVADKLEVFPGSEFRVAFEEGMSYGAKIILGDRPVHITLRRSWGKMTLWHKAKFLFYVLFQAIFLPSPEDLNKMLKEMDDDDMLTLVIQEMSKAFPTLMETLVHERDMYMSSTLITVAREHTSVVAVVGKGHLPGIKKHWKQPIEVRHLLEVPGVEAPTRSTGVPKMKILASIGAVAAIISGVYLVAKR